MDLLRPVSPLISKLSSVNCINRSAAVSQQKERIVLEAAGYMAACQVILSFFQRCINCFCRWLSCNPINVWPAFDFGLMKTPSTLYSMQYIYMSLVLVVKNLYTFVYHIMSIFVNVN